MSAMAARTRESGTVQDNWLSAAQSARHQAAHAIAAWRCGLRPGAITVSGGLSARCTLPLPADAVAKLLAGAASHAELQDWIVICLAGAAADAVVRGRDALSGSPADIDEAYDLAEQETGCREELEGMIQGLWGQALGLMREADVQAARELLVAEVLVGGDMREAAVCALLNRTLPRPHADEG